MKNTILLASGLWTGLLIAQIMFTTAARNGGSPGGELLALLAIPLLLVVGYTTGYDTKRTAEYHKGCRDGYDTSADDVKSGCLPGRFNHGNH